MSAFGLREDMVRFIADNAKLCGISKVILFESRATGRFSEKSDIDLAISGGSYDDYVGVLEERCPTLLAFDFIDLSKGIGKELLESF